MFKRIQRANGSRIQISTRISSIIRGKLARARDDSNKVGIDLDRIKMQNIDTSIHLPVKSSLAESGDSTYTYIGGNFQWGP